MYDEPMDERFSLLKQAIASGVKSGYTDTDREVIDDLVRELNSEYESWPDGAAYFFLDFYNDDFAVEDDQTTIPFSLHERRVLFRSEPMDERFSLLKQAIASGVKSGYTDTDREVIDDLVRELNSEYESWPDGAAYFFLDFYNDDFAVEDDQTTIPFSLHERRVLF